MERLLKDYLVDRTREKENCYSLICAVCGKIWTSTPRADQARGADKEAAAHEAADGNSICRFCGRPVCLECLEDVEGILLCTQCADKLRQRLEA
jgi:hypothetical protein